MVIWQLNLAKRLGFLLGLFGLFCLSQACKASPFSVTLSSLQQQQLAQKIEQRETAGKTVNLTFWSKHESFPSFGIGHFIWLPENSSQPFQQTFPELVDYLALKSEPPSWLKNQTNLVLPWQTRQQFYADFEGQKLLQLRNWLQQTKQLQAEFIFQRFLKQVNHAKSTLNDQQHRIVNQQLKRLTSSSKGLFALIDYVNFKGVGNNKFEVYLDGTKQVGWGLIDVFLSSYNYSDDGLNDFVQSAKNVLKRRANLSEQQTEKRWLKGWYHRLESYLEPSYLEVETSSDIKQ